MATALREAEFLSPLGKDALLFRRLQAREELGRLPEYRVELLRLSISAPIDADKLLGKQADVLIEMPDSKQRYINGWVTRFERGGSVGRFDVYRVELRPWLWYLTLGADCRIFQDLNALEIIEKVFADYTGAQVEKKLSGSFRKRAYCVQYRESDFDFVSRLMEEEGIYYFFKQEKGRHTLVLCNSASGHSALGDPELAWSAAIKDDSVRESVVTQWQRSQTLTSLKYTHLDHAFDVPKITMDSAQRSSSLPKPGDLEVFDYPGAFVNLGHDLEKGTATPDSEAKRLAQLRVDAFESAHTVVSALSPCRSLAAGYTFGLEKHPSDDGDYLITEAQFEMEYSGYEGIEQRRDDGFGCRFQAVPKAVAFQPQPRMRRPVIAGPQTATVVGPSGDELHTDKQGRVKLQFRWDRVGTRNEKSSCWVRVSHPWAGKGFGMIALPRIGDDVVVEFLEGNPDRPLVTGRVYNGANPPPYTLPDNATISGIKTSSSKGGATTKFNELRFQDEKDKEYIWLRAERDFHRWVKNDVFDKIDNDAWSTVAKNVGSKIGENFSFSVGKVSKLKFGQDVHADLGADLNLKIGGALGLKIANAADLKTGQALKLGVGAALDIDAGQTIKLSATSAIHIKGLSLVIDASTQVSIKAGPSFITVGPDGVSISGPMVKINSGGSASAANPAAQASPAAPQAPEDPKPNEDPLSKKK
jgi:type VI secretion system secreted protein VgrG